MGDPHPATSGDRLSRFEPLRRLANPPFSGALKALFYPLNYGSDGGLLDVLSFKVESCKRVSQETVDCASGDFVTYGQIMGVLRQNEGICALQFFKFLPSVLAPSGNTILYERPITSSNLRHHLTGRNPG